MNKIKSIWKYLFSTSNNTSAQNVMLMNERLCHQSLIVQKKFEDAKGLIK